MKQKRSRKPAARTDAGLTESNLAGKLTEAMKLVVVQRLAMFDTPQTVADAVKEDYGIEITRQSVQYYDPTVGEKPAEKWCAIFAATRKKFLEETAAVPIAQQSVRLRRLDYVCVRAQKSGNHAMVLASSEQAAKEVGGAYTNRHKMEVTGKDGGAIEVKTNDLRDKIARRISGVAARIGANPNHSGAVASGAGGS